jgi:hypothetical protein
MFTGEAVKGEQVAEGRSDVRVQNGMVIIPIVKGVLVLTKAEFVQGLRRGKQWKRQQALQARTQREWLLPSRRAREQDALKDRR